MRITRTSFFLLCVSVFSIVFFYGCNGQDPGQSSESVLLDGDDIVLARVNGSPVTRYECDRVIDATIGEKNASKLDDEGRQKILESLVASRAIAQRCETQLTGEERAELAKKVQAYREQLLVKKYIAKTVTPEPVSQEMVNTYYQAHPEKFGAESLRTYEMITTSRNPKPDERDTLIAILVHPETKKDWKKWVQEIERKGFPVLYNDGRVVEKLLHPKLNTLMNGLKVGESSSMSFIDGRPYLVRITNEESIPPRPLAEVSSQIRKSLGPVQLKKAVKQISDDVLKTVDVEYKKIENNN